MTQQYSLLQSPKRESGLILKEMYTTMRDRRGERALWIKTVIKNKCHETSLKQKRCNNICTHCSTSSLVERFSLRKGYTGNAAQTLRIDDFCQLKK